MATNLNAMGQTPSPVPVANTVVGITGNSPEEWWKGVTCYRCGGLGHIARMCPSADSGGPPVTLPVQTPPNQVQRGRGRGFGGGRGNSNWRGGRGRGRKDDNGSGKNETKSDGQRSDSEKKTSKPEEATGSQSLNDPPSLNKCTKMRRRRPRRTRKNQLRAMVVPPTPKRVELQQRPRARRSTYQLRVQLPPGMGSPMKLPRGQAN